MEPGSPGVILSHHHQIHITVLPPHAVVVTISQMNSNTSSNVDYPELVAETLQIWEQNARWWDAKMGEGNTWHRSLIAPATERLLSTQPGERVLELACGNGQFARRLASFGVHVVACDFSRAFLDCARLRTREHADRIDYRLLDLTSEDETAALGTSEFDAAVCNMALMDIASITPVLRAVWRALKPNGRFVFSVPHPCFNTNGTTLLAERDDYEDQVTLSFGVRVKRYKGLTPQRAVGMVGQPQPHYYFHRPLQILLATCFVAGFVLDGLEEPAFDVSAGDLTLRWDNCAEIPPILVARLRPTRPVD
ncbi:MAG: SAM-dependent methyltransferase [Acidobacteria bacterium]|nr:MAG: SAM-dependent methyltransferase [Acidobacteriota bacterium]